MRTWLLAVVVVLPSACEKQEEAPKERSKTTVSEAEDHSADAPVVRERHVGYSGPNETDRRRALGDLGKLSPVERVALSPSEHFQALPAPGPTDWLSIHPEPGQSFDDFRMYTGGNRVIPSRRTIYLQPITPFRIKGAPTLEEMRRFAQTFFDLPVEVLPARPSSEMNRGSRQAMGGRQLLTQTVLSALRARVPKDAYAVLALTAEDLYPGPGWNFVFGQATFRERIGVHSLARYAPSFYGKGDRGAGRVMRKRAYTVLAHEIGHMFGMHHCPYYRCIMNGSNGLDETDRTPLHLCPVCMRKLAFITNTDMAKRHRRLARHLSRVGLAASSRWHSQRAALIRAATREASAENATARR